MVGLFFTDNDLITCKTGSMRLLYHLKLVILVKTMRNCRTVKDFFEASVSKIVPCKRGACNHPKTFLLRFFLFENYGVVGKFTGKCHATNFVHVEVMHVVKDIMIY